LKEGLREPGPAGEEGFKERGGVLVGGVGHLMERKGAM